MNSRFYQNKECEAFPCHEIDNINTFNCLFCYCPLYLHDHKCGGHFSVTDTGIKDCSGCVIPHDASNYEYILQKTIELYKANG